MIVGQQQLPVTTAFDGMPLGLPQQHMQHGTPRARHIKIVQVIAMAITATTANAMPMAALTSVAT